MLTIDLVQKSRPRKRLIERVNMMQVSNMAKWTTSVAFRGQPSSGSWLHWSTKPACIMLKASSDLYVSLLQYYHLFGRLFAAHSNVLKALKFFNYSLKITKSLHPPNPSRNHFTFLWYIEKAWDLILELSNNYPNLLTFKSMNILFVK